MKLSNSTRPLYAGVAKSDISTHSPDMLVNDPLYAKALVLDDGDTRLAIIAMDAVAIGGICDIGDDFLGKLRSRIEKELGIAGKNILVNATHTHTDEPMLCETAEQLEKTFDAVSRAYKSMVEVKVSSGVGYEDSIMINRTLRLKNGMHWTVRQAYPCPFDSEVDSLGPIDPNIGILRIDHLDEKPLAVVYTFSCHPLLGVPNRGVTANFPGFASKVIEENFGGMALFLQGTGGDVTEVLYKDTTRPMDSEPVGRILGLSTLKTLREIQTEKDKTSTALSTAYDIIKLPRRTDIPKRIEALKKEQRELLKSLRGTSLNFRSLLGNI